MNRQRDAERLDHLVAEYVMGWVRMAHTPSGRCWHDEKENLYIPMNWSPTRLRACLWEVLKQFTKLGQRCRVAHIPGGWEATISTWQGEAISSAEAGTNYTAICMAAVRANGGESYV